MRDMSALQGSSRPCRGTREALLLDSVKSIVFRALQHGMFTGNAGLLPLCCFVYPPFPRGPSVTVLCLQQFKAEVTLASTAGTPLARLQQLRDFCTHQPNPSPARGSLSKTLLVHVAPSVAGTWLPWHQNSNVGQGLNSLQAARVLIQSPGLCGSAGVSLEQLECGVSQ